MRELKPGEKYTLKINDALAQFFSEKGCIVVDKRPSGGCLWVAGDKNTIGAIVAEAESKYGVTGRYGKGRAIQYQTGWYTKDNT